MSTAERVIADLRDADMTIACAESLTGGMVCSELVGVAGASDVVVGGVVAYATEAKAMVLGVDPETLAAHGPVSEPVAAQMAQRAAALFNADIGVATTGVAGPQSVGDHPVGEVYVAVSRRGGDTVVQRFVFDGDRDDIRHSSVRAVMQMLIEFIGAGVSDR